MGIAIGLGSVSITALGIIFAYIWKSNGKLQRQMMSSLEQMMFSLEHIEQGQKGIAEIVKDVAKMVVEHGKVLERMEARMSSK